MPDLALPEVLLLLNHHLPWHWYLPQLGQPEDLISTMVEVVSGLLLGVPSMAVDLNLFKEEISWKGEAGGKVRPLKAMVIWVVVMRPPPLPSPLPHPTMGRHNLGACGGQAQPSGRLARMGNEVGRLHGQPRAAKMPQQEQGQGVAGMLQEYLGWVKRPQGGHR